MSCDESSVSVELAGFSVFDPIMMLVLWPAPSMCQCKREREKHYISSSHLGLIRCLTPFRVRISTIASI